MRSVPGISHLSKPLDNAIDTFTKVLLQGYTFNPTERVLFSLPANYGGIALIIPSKICQEEYENSRAITREATYKVMRNEIQFQDNRVSTAKIKTDTKNRKKKLNAAKLQEVTSNTSTKLRSVEASTKNGVSIWLTLIPVKRNVFFSGEASLLGCNTNQIQYPSGTFTNTMCLWRLV